MAWPLHVFSFLDDDFLQRLLSTVMLFAAGPLLGAAASFLFTRHDDDDDEGRPNWRRKSFDAAARLEQQDDSSTTCLQLNTAFRPMAEAYVPRVILDSGASRHAVGDASLLSSFLTIAPPAGSDAAANYRARDGRLLAVAGAGTISIGNFNLPDVLYVPELRIQVILVSVPQLAQKGYHVMFGGGQCSVKDQSSSRIVGKGRLHKDDSLYHLEFLDLRPHDDTAGSSSVDT